MRIYISGSMKDQALFQVFMDDLRVRGHTIVSRWLTADVGSKDYETPAWFEKWSRIDAEDVAACDVLVCFSNSMNPTSRNRGGKHTELGMALVLGKTLFLVGDRTQPFHYHPRVQVFANWHDAKMRLDDMVALEHEMRNDRGRNYCLGA